MNNRTAHISDLNKNFPKAINFHLLRACNAGCRYCFAAFPETPTHLNITEAIQVMRLVRDAGGEKMNFVGGEPTLHKEIQRLVLEAKAMGYTTSIVSNGVRLAELLDSSAGAALDWVGLSIDSASDAGNAQIGRGGPGYTAQIVSLARRAHAQGAKVKLNSVIHRLNHQEAMHDLVRSIRPSRWKLFQVLKVKGQNDGAVEELLITTEQFVSFVERHRCLEQEGIIVVPEDNDAMTDSYAMIDPLGRFFGDSGGIHRIGKSILEAGAVEALASVGFQPLKLVQRGGVYDWAPGGPPKT